MELWILFWKIICFVGFTAFILTVLFIVPFGARDIIRLFKSLGRKRTH